MTKKNNRTASATTLAISKNSKILALFAIACTGLVGLVNELTQDKIKEQEQLQLLSTLNAIIDPSRYDNDIANDCIITSSPLLGSTNMHTAYIARKNDNVIALAITSTAPKGYNGNIELIVGINIDETISGVRVLKHQETPGLGDKIEITKNDWITSFKGKKLLSDSDNRWTVIKDGGTFDQFTGATITPRAVVHAVKDTLTYFKQYKESLQTLPNSCTSKPSTDESTEKNAITEVKNEQ
jgi:electron transport complex protein RnfG